MGLRARSSYWPFQWSWSGVNGEKRHVEGYSVSLASILMILACQCFLFEEQFNKQSLAFHVEGKICNDIHLPGSSSSTCDWIKPSAMNTAGKALVALNTLACPPPPPPAQDKNGWGWGWGMIFKDASGICLHFSCLKNTSQGSRSWACTYIEAP